MITILTVLRTKKLVRLGLVALAVGFVLLNAVAYMQASAMLHYAPAGAATPQPESLSLVAKMRIILLGAKIPRPENSGTPAAVGLDYETRGIPISGTELAAWYAPAQQERAIVLMFPGYATAKSLLLRPAAAFHEMGYSVLMIDFRGEGDSTGSDTTLGFREADDVAASVSYARKEWPGQKVVLYGVSMGSSAILRAVSRGVSADALVIETPFNSMVDTAANRFHALGLPAFPSAQLIVLWGSVQQGYNGFAHNPEDYARKVSMPTFLMYGGLDSRVTPAQSARIFANLAGQKQLLEFPSAVHQLLIDADPTIWKQHVSTFLGGLGI